MLKQGARFIRMQDAGSFRLPPEAKIVHAGMAEKLNQGDHVKFCVEGDNGAREKFWALFDSYDHENRTMNVTVNNDMVYTEFHGLKCSDQITIPAFYLCAAMGK